MKKKGILIFALLLFTVGGGIYAYPTVSSAVYQIKSASSIKGYQKQVEQADDAAMDAMIARAEAYNKTLSDILSIDPFQTGAGEPDLDDLEYNSLLNMDGLMGYIDIPVIDVYLPVYHGTGVVALKKGAGHLYGSALPVGGEGTHSVISAHRGLPSAKMFTDLDQVREGDVFYYHVLNRILAYQVDRIEVVEPTQLSALDPVPGKDYMTLFTCTPYGINSHRLLVRGVRIPYEVTTAKEAALNAPENQPKLDAKVSPVSIVTAAAAGIILLAALAVLVSLTVPVFIRAMKRRRRKKKGRRK